MSANNDVPHLLVLSEDDANRQIVNGFANHHQLVPRRMHLEPVAGGWREALELFRDQHVALMRRFPERRVLIVIDFDGHPDRFEVALGYIPKELRDRVFVMGCADKPERLTADLGCKKEGVGAMLAEDCDHDTTETWGHVMLANNAAELVRMRDRVKRFLFRAA